MYDKLFFICILSVCITAMSSLTDTFYKASTRICLITCKTRMSKFRYLQGCNPLVCMSVNIYTLTHTCRNGEETSVNIVHRQQWPLAVDDVFFSFDVFKTKS